VKSAKINSARKNFAQISSASNFFPQGTVHDDDVTCSGCGA